MKIGIEPSSLSGSLTIPASKSAMQRACAAALINKGEAELLNPGVSDDDKAALSIIQQLGAVVEWKEDKVLVKSKGLRLNAAEIDCGESGLSTRMFTMIASCIPDLITINGHGSLLKRPLDFSVLKELGVHIKSSGGYLPIQVKGPLQPRNIEIDGSLSSQYLTGLLFAYSASGAKGVSIKVGNLASRPYIDLTLQIMEHFGLNVPENDNYKEFHFKDGGYKKERITYLVEGDWSSASFPLVGAAISGEMILKGLKGDSVQSDRKIIDVIKQAGAEVMLGSDQIEVRSSSLNAFEFDATDCPDLFPPLAALACNCKGETRIKGAERLVFKESNRAETIESEFRKMGAQISFKENTMIVQGGQLQGAEVSSHGDHRIAMALAIAALKAKGRTLIDGAESVNKSYPQFWAQMSESGMRTILKP